jgi:transcriptional regulator with XRE-family HTH domain
MCRAALGWSSRRLAEEAGVTPNTVTNLEMGRPVRFSTLNRIRAVLMKAGITIDAQGGVWPPP